LNVIKIKNGTQESNRKHFRYYFGITMVEESVRISVLIVEIWKRAPNTK